MIKETIEFLDYDGNKRVEDHYFHLNKAELVEMRFSKEGGLEEYIKKIIDTNKQDELIKLFKDLVLKAYGKKSDDGRRFIKTDELRDEFVQTEAYSELFMKLATDAEAAKNFVNGIIPNELQEQ